jgi:hypothetical protein
MVTNFTALLFIILFRPYRYKVIYIIHIVGGMIILGVFGLKLNDFINTENLIAEDTSNDLIRKWFSNGWLTFSVEGAFIIVFIIKFLAATIIFIYENRTQIVPSNSREPLQSLAALHSVRIELH